MKSNVGFFRKTNTIDGREVEEAEAEQRKPSVLLQDNDLPTEHWGALLGTHNASHFVWNWSDIDNPSHASVGTVQQLNQWGIWGKPQTPDAEFSENLEMPCGPQRRFENNGEAVQSSAQDDGCSLDLEEPSNVKSFVLLGVEVGRRL